MPVYSDTLCIILCIYFRYFFSFYFYMLFSKLLYLVFLFLMFIFAQCFFSSAQRLLLLAVVSMFSRYCSPLACSFSYCRFLHAHVLLLSARGLTARPSIQPRSPSWSLLCSDLPLAAQLFHPCLQSLMQVLICNLKNKF